MPKFLDDIEFPIEGGKGIHWDTIIDEPIIKADLNTENGVANTYYQHTGVTTNIYKNGLIYFCTGTEFKVIDGGSGGGGGGSVDIDPADFVTIEGEQTVRGNKSFNGHVYFNGNTDLKMIFAPQSDGSNVFTKGKDGQVLKTNGSTVYWGDDNAYSSSSGGGAIVELSGESGKLTDEQYLQCTNPTTVIKWFNGSGAHSVYEYWRYISPTIYFRSVYINADECINNIIEIDQISHGWKRKSTAYSGGSTVSVTQTLTSGTKIGAITVDGKTTALYAPEGSSSGGGGGSGSVPADAIIDVDKLPAEENAYLFQNGAKVEEYLMRKVVVHVVDTLPDVGALFLTSTSCNIYYQKGDDEAYCYLTPDVPPGGNFTGWAGLSSGFGWVSDFGYGGVITDESQATDTSRKYLVYHEEEYINEKAFYRVTEFNVSTLLAGMVNMFDKPVTVHVVDTLPTTGEYVMQGNLANPSSYVIYYQKSDNSVYAWVPTALGAPTDMWLPIENVLAMKEVSYGGVITSAEEAIGQYTVYVLVKISIKLYHYKDGWHEIGGSSSGSVGGNSPQIITAGTLDEMFANLSDKTISIQINGSVAYNYKNPNTEHEGESVYDGLSLVPFRYLQTQGLQIVHGSLLFTRDYYDITISKAAGQIYVAMGQREIDYTSGVWKDWSASNPELDINSIYITNAP